MSKEYVKALSRVVSQGVCRFTSQSIKCAGGSSCSIGFGLDENGIRSIPERPGRANILRAVHCGITPFDPSGTLH